MKSKIVAIGKFNKKLNLHFIKVDSEYLDENKLFRQGFQNFVNSDK